MIRHVVMFKFKDETSDDDRQQFVNSLHQLTNDIDVIKQLEVGENVTDSPRACDVVLIVDLEGENALRVYGDHPDHQPVKQRAGEICSASYVVDYPLPAG